MDEQEYIEVDIMDIVKIDSNTYMVVTELGDLNGSDCSSGKCGKHGNGCNKSGCKHHEKSITVCAECKYGIRNADIPLILDGRKMPYRFCQVHKAFILANNPVCGQAIRKV